MVTEDPSAGFTLDPRDGEQRGNLGFYRIVEMQPASLDKMRLMFDDGRYPREEVRAARRAAKAKRKRGGVAPL